MNEYNDTYRPASSMFDCTEWELVEFEHNILKNRRLELELTQQQVADIAKIQLRQYQKLESGERSVYGASFRIAISVCKALQLDPQRFIDCI